MRGLSYIGKCVECGCSLYYNEMEEKLVAKGGLPDCLHRHEREEEEEEEEDGET